MTGVSGSGKTTLVREVLLPALLEKLKTGLTTAKASERIETEGDGEDQDDSNASNPPTTLEGWDLLDKVVLVDQSLLGKTPRSNPAVYIGAFDDIRELFTQSEQAQRRGLNSSAFSFNSSQGQCQRCRGAGFEKIEMQFLCDVYIRCPDCDGRRYRDHILDLKIYSQRSEGKPAEKPYSLKYRLYYGLADGTPLLRNVNETGKGDHRHREGREEPYEFKDVETLVADFLKDIDKARMG